MNWNCFYKRLKKEMKECPVLAVYTKNMVMACLSEKNKRDKEILAQLRAIKVEKLWKSIVKIVHGILSVINKNAL